jgi:primosomal protein N' (replication factor Y)
VALPARHGNARMPEIGLVDLRRDRPPRGGFLAPPLREALYRNLEGGAQSLLFLNRRGYAPLTLCRACGHRLACPNCSTWLVAHRLRGRLQCHHCGYGMTVPEHCPSCGAVGLLTASGPGVERLAEELGEILPKARLAVMTSDTASDTASAVALVEAMERHEVDILIGTQIIAKGHHFPDLTLVGVVDADLGLGGGDLRAAERTFQLLYQVAGRAGREDRPGRVLIQTHLPEHPVMQALAVGDKDRFLAVELEERRIGEMPPFGRLAALIVSGGESERVKAEARRIAQAAPLSDQVLVLGPTPAPLALLRGRYRERLLIKAAPELDLPAWLRTWLSPLKIPGKILLQVDVDPVSFL